jgi:hypothetical protein
VTGALRAVYRYVMPIFFLALVVQVFLAGLGIFGGVEEIEGAGSIDSDGWEDEISAHAGFGHLLWLVSIAIFLLSLAARLGRNRVLLTLALPVLLFVQIVLAAGGEEAPVVGALHPVNALVILALVGYLAWGSWRRWTDLGEPVGSPRTERV